MFGLFNFNFISAYFVDVNEVFYSNYYEYSPNTKEICSLHYFAWRAFRKPSHRILEMLSYSTRELVLLLTFPIHEIKWLLQWKSRVRKKVYISSRRSSQQWPVAHFFLDRHVYLSFARLLIGLTCHKFFGSMSFSRCIVSINLFTRYQL